MTRIINLPERRDRRREVTKELAAVGIRVGSKNVEFFEAVRSAEAAGFPSPAVRGCFLSHLGVLREAEELGQECVLIMEDDLSIARELPEAWHEIQDVMDGHEWGIVYFGYTYDDRIDSGVEHKMVRSAAPVGCAHFYAIHQRIFRRLIEFLEVLQQREPGHPIAGPMHYDGALATFRALNPDVVTLIANPCLGFQRSSRSDIDIRWYERVPVLRQAADLARAVLAWFRTETNASSST